MNENLYAALRNGVMTGAVPHPISGESIDDYRFRAAHAGALIGIQWLQDASVAAAEAAAEARAEVEAATHETTSDDAGQGRRHGESTPPTPLVLVPDDHPEQEGAAGA
jgi:hypothetical protein